VYERGTHRHESEPDDQHGKVVLGPNHLENDVTRHFNKHVHNVKDRSDPIEALANKMKVGLHSLNTCVSDVGSETSQHWKSSFDAQ
jgi:hypothetical protein